MTKAEAKVFAKFTDHCRTTCSDDNPVNWYTTDGRGGYPRCDRCMFLKASKDAEFAKTVTPEASGYQPSEDE